MIGKVPLGARIAQMLHGQQEKAEQAKLIGPPTTFTPHCPLCQRTLGNVKDLGKFRWLQHNRTCRCGVRWLVGIRTKIVPYSDGSTGPDGPTEPTVVITEVHYDRS